ncbi:hypothetical protein [Bradyrhizobium cenepequi]
MRPLAIVGTAALLASALVAPAGAQQVIYNPGYCAQFYPNANCQNKGPGNPYTGNYQQRRAAAYQYNSGWNNSYARWDGGRTDFWPGNVAAGVVGGAVGTAAAVATAPFAGFDNGYRGGYYTQSYAERNGFACTPGTWFRGEDGRRHPCQ